MKRSRQQQSSPSRDADAARPTESTGTATEKATSAKSASAGTSTAEVEELLRKLADSTRSTGQDDAPDFETIVDDATGHTDRLRATMTAQQEANELLAVAQKVRGAASEQAEQILAEAKASAEHLMDETRQAADRIRREASEKTRQQQSEVETLVRDLRDSATRDADRIRAEALGTAMADAERTAREYTTKAMAQGARDAEVIRDEARDVLRQSTSLLALSAQSLQELAGTIGSFVDSLQTQTRAMELLHEDAERRVEDHGTTRLEASADASGRDDDRDESGDAAGDESAEIDPGSAAEGKPLGSLFRGAEESRTGRKDR